MEFQEALEYMNGLRAFGIKLGNERFEALMDRLGNPHRRYRVVHVTGTKGKGSTTAMAAAILHEHGFRVGSYFSPYVFDIRERVQVDGVMIPPIDFARLVSIIRPHVEALAATNHGQTTEFELKTAVGFVYFAEREVDFAVVEVGIGGRLDATNIVTPVASVITNIGLDHTHILGDTVAKIAYEKAGIIKSTIPCITAVDVPEAFAVIRDVAQLQQSPLIHVRQLSLAHSLIQENEIGWETTGGETAAWPTFQITTSSYAYDGLRVGMAGAFQQVNAACAIGAVEAAATEAGFSIQSSAVRAGLRSTILPGRMQIVRTSPALLLDGAHNAIAASALRDVLGKLEYDRMLLVIGMVAGHEPRGVVDVLAPLASRMYATRPTWNRGIPAEEIAEAARAGESKAEIQVAEPPIHAARLALADAGPRDLVLVTGSFYVVGDVNPALLNP